MHLLDKRNQTTKSFRDFLVTLNEKELFLFVQALYGKAEHEAATILFDTGIIVKTLYYRNSQLVFQFYYKERPGDLSTISWPLVHNYAYFEAMRQGVISVTLDLVNEIATNLLFVPGLSKSLTKSQIARGDVKAAMQDPEVMVNLSTKEDGTACHFTALSCEQFFVTTNGSSTILDKIAAELEYALNRTSSKFVELTFDFFLQKYPTLQSLGLSLELHQRDFSLVTLQCPGTFGVNSIVLVLSDSSFVTVQDLVEFEQYLIEQKARVSRRFRARVQNDTSGQFLPYFEDAYLALKSTFECYAEYCPSKAEILTSLEGWVVEYIVDNQSYFVKYKTDIFRVFNQVSYGANPKQLKELRIAYAQFATAVLEPADERLTILYEPIAQRITALKDALRKRSSPGKYLSPKNSDSSDEVILLSHKEELLPLLENSEKLFCEILRTRGRGRFSEAKYPELFAFLSSLNLLSFLNKKMETLLNMPLVILKKYLSIADSIATLRPDMPIGWAIICTPDYFYDQNSLKKMVTRRTISSSQQQELSEKYSAIAKMFTFSRSIVTIDLDGTLLYEKKSCHRYGHYTFDGRARCEFSWHLWNSLLELFPNTEFILLTGAKISAEECLALLPESVASRFSMAISGSFDITPAEQKCSFLSALPKDISVCMIDDDLSVQRAIAHYCNVLPVFSHPEFGTSLYPPKSNHFVVRMIGLPGSGKSTLASSLGGVHINLDAAKLLNRDEGCHNEALQNIQGILKRAAENRLSPTDPELLIIDTLGREAVKPFECSHCALIFVPQELYSLCLLSGDVYSTVVDYTQNKKNIHMWKKLCESHVTTRQNSYELYTPASTITTVKYQRAIDSIFNDVLKAILSVLKSEIPVLFTPICCDTSRELNEKIALLRQSAQMSKNPLYTGLFFMEDNQPYHITLSYKPHDMEQAIMDVVQKPKETVRKIAKIKHETDIWISVDYPGVETAHITISSLNPGNIKHKIAMNLGEVITTYQDEFVTGYRCNIAL